MSKPRGGYRWHWILLLLATFCQSAEADESLGKVRSLVKYLEPLFGPVEKISSVGKDVVISRRGVEETLASDAAVRSGDRVSIGSTIGVQIEIGRHWQFTKEKIVLAPALCPTSKYQWGEFEFVETKEPKKGKSKTYRAVIPHYGHLYIDASPFAVIGSGLAVILKSEAIVTTDSLGATIIYLKKGALLIPSYPNIRVKPGQALSISSNGVPTVIGGAPAVIELQKIGQVLPESGGRWYQESWFTGSLAAASAVAIGYTFARIGEEGKAEPCDCSKTK